MNKYDSVEDDDFSSEKQNSRSLLKIAIATVSIGIVFLTLLAVLPNFLISNPSSSIAPSNTQQTQEDKSGSYMPWKPWMR